MAKFSHMYDIAFEVVNCNGDNVTGAEVREAIVNKLARLNDDDLLEHIGFCDVWEMESEEDMEVKLDNQFIEICKQMQNEIEGSNDE